MFSAEYFSGDNDSAPSEFSALRSDVVSEIDWSSDALGAWYIVLLPPNSHELKRSGRQPEAVNIWIGNGKSVTSIHSGTSNICKLISI